MNNKNQHAENEEYKMKAAPAAKPAEANKMKRKALKACASLSSRILLLTLVCFVLLEFIFGFHVVKDNSMQPRVSEGDVVMFYRIGTDDLDGKCVIVYSTADGNNVGRIVAKGGDVVSFDEDGYLFVNGAIQAETDIYSRTYTDNAEIEFPYTVPEGAYFVLGDNRTAANDSRIYGAVTYEDVKGEVIALVRRRGF